MWMSTDSQTVPYVTLMGEILPNNSYVDFSLVGDRNSGGEGVQCHTDLTTCCSRHQGMERGDWYAPDSVTRLPFYESGNLKSVFEHRDNQKVILYHRPWVTRSNITSGIYRCDIAVTGSGRGIIYMGMYESGGNIKYQFILFAKI